MFRPPIVAIIRMLFFEVFRVVGTENIITSKNVDLNENSLFYDKEMYQIFR
jgi:hypothetical protein